MGGGGAAPHSTLFFRLCLSQTIWDEHDNRTRLAERIDSINRWKETLDKCLTDLDAEIDALTQAGSPGWRPSRQHLPASPLHGDLGGRIHRVTPRPSAKAGLGCFPGDGPTSVPGPLFSR